MQVSVEEWDACPLVAESPPPHVIALKALQVTKLGYDAVIPKKGSAAAAGYDLSLWWCLAVLCFAEAHDFTLTNGQCHVDLD